LLFYTSRYATHVAQRLTALAENQPVSLDGFRAQHMNPEQRACMSRLLSFPPDPYTARAIAALAAAVAAGSGGVPAAAQAIAGRCATRPFLQVAAVRPRVSTGLAELGPVEALRHLGRRYGFPVQVVGRRVHIDTARVSGLVAADNAVVRHNLLEILQALSRAGYTVVTEDLRYAPLARSA
jgi:hypothetical protein